MHNCLKINRQNASKDTFADILRFFDSIILQKYFLATLVSKLKRDKRAFFLIFLIIQVWLLDDN